MCGRDDRVAAVACAGRGQRDVVGVRVKYPADLAEAVIGEEVKELVLEDRPADAAAELVLLVHRLGQQEGVAVVIQHLVLAVWIERVQVRVAQVVEEIAMQVLVPLLVMAFTWPPAAWPNSTE